MLTTAHILNFVLPTVTAAACEGWLCVGVRAHGSVDALVLLCDFMHIDADLLMELELTALHLGDGLVAGTMFVSLADPIEGVVVFAAKIGEFFANLS